MFDAKVHEAFKRHACEQFPKEAVGLVVERAGEVFYRPLDNLHETPEKAFLFDGSHYAKAKEEGDVLSVLHSHTPFEDVTNQGSKFMNITEHPSKADMELQLRLEIPFGIGLCTGSDSCSEPFYFGDQTPIAPLVGRTYMYNVRCCYPLVRDYYRTREVNPFTIPMVPSDNKWWHHGENIIEEGLEASGFKEIGLSEVRVGDAFLAKILSPVINHVGVMVEPHLILHHLQDALSCREPVSKWQNFVVKWVRHEKDF